MPEGSRTDQAPSAWLFDVYPHPRRSALVVWIKHGGSVTKRLVPYHPSFCVKPETQRLEQAEAILAQDKRVARTWRATTRLWLNGPEQEVLRVQPKRLQDTWSVATDLRKRTHTKGFLFFDVDHTQECRWMHSQGLWSMCRLRVGPRGPELSAAEEDARWTVHYPNPDLRAVRLEVEAIRMGNVPRFSDPLRAIRVGGREFACGRPGDPSSEAATLRAFGDHLRAIDPDVLLTRHGDRFDIPFLLHRIRALGLRPEVNLGRDPDPEPDRPDQQSKSIHTYGRWLFKTHAYYLRGRWHIDLSKKTLDSEDDRKDLHGIVYLARVSNRRAQDVNRNGAGFALQQMQIDLAIDRGVALPWKRNLSEDWKDAATLCAVDRGGQIMVPRPGIYEDVAACDFSGYYPSLVVRHNLSSDSLNCSCCPDGDVIPELEYHVCKRKRGHQAEILERLGPHRRWAKAVLKMAKLEAQAHDGSGRLDLQRKFEEPSRGG
jgi:DNA polymerase-2